MRLFRRRGKIHLPSAEQQRRVPIVGDAAIAAARIGDGKLIPLVIIDTSERSDLDEVIRLHAHLGPGDVKVQWGMPLEKTDKIILVLSFRNPIEAVAILEFDIVLQGILVDQILTARVFYLQSGRPGDRYITNPSAPRIFVEVPDTGVRGHWDKLFHKRVAKHMRAKGLGRQQAKSAAAQAIQEMRAVGRFRMKCE